MDRILITLKKENCSRASSAPAAGLNTIIFKYVYWCMKRISGERLQDHWSSGLNIPLVSADTLAFFVGRIAENKILRGSTFSYSEAGVKQYVKNGGYQAALDDFYSVEPNYVQKLPEVRVIRLYFLWVSVNSICSNFF